MKEAEETPLNSMEVEGLIVMLQRASKDGGEMIATLPREYH
jgi:hypothetical protein